MLILVISTVFKFRHCTLKSQVIVFLQFTFSFLTIFISAPLQAIIIILIFESHLPHYK